MDREKESIEPIFDINDRGFNAKAWYLKDTEKSKGDAIVEIKKNGNLLRKFIFPAYKIWNIPAHFNDIVEGELKNSVSGYRVAASTGLEGLKEAT